MTEVKEDTFKRLSQINVDDFVETKMGLKYLSWAKALAILKSTYPDAEYKIYTRKMTINETKTTSDGGITNTVTTSYETEVPYFTDGKTCFVKVGVIINGREETEIFPVMDLKNNSVSYSVVKSVDVNKALQRAFVKACARHGLGINIYMGEEFKEEMFEEKKPDPITEEVKRLVSIKVVPNKFKNATEFNNVKQEVCDILSKDKWPDNVNSKSIYEAVSKVLAGTRVSALEYANGTEDIDKLNLISYIIKGYKNLLLSK